MLKWDQHCRSLSTVKTATRCVNWREFRDPHVPYTLFQCRMNNVILKVFYYLVHKNAWTYIYIVCIYMHWNNAINLIIEKVFKFHYFSLCVRLRILQIGTPLKILSNQYIFHCYNTIDSFFVYLCVLSKSTQISTFLESLGTNLSHSILPPSKKWPSDLCTDHVPLRYIILRNSTVLCATALV